MKWIDSLASRAEFSDNKDPYEDHEANWNYVTDDRTKMLASITVWRRRWRSKFVVAYASENMPMERYHAIVPLRLIKWIVEYKTADNVNRKWRIEQ